MLRSYPVPTVVEYNKLLIEIESEFNKILATQLDVDERTFYTGRLRNEKSISRYAFVMHEIACVLLSEEKADVCKDIATQVGKYSKREGADTFADLALLAINSPSAASVVTARGFLDASYGLVPRNSGIVKSRDNIESMIRYQEQEHKIPRP